MLNNSKTTNDLICHICNAASLELFPEYEKFPRVASDCTPWPEGGRLGICHHCACVQNPVDKNWHTETENIYNRYHIYGQSAGNEGVVSTGTHLLPRSQRIFQQAASYFNIQEPGKLLDIGCANGELLRYFGTLAPNWRMVGFEIDDKRKSEVESIPGVQAFYSEDINKIPPGFDVITLVHVLEHLPHPILWLKKLRTLLNKNGIIIIQLPDPKINPFNLLVADHCSHFILDDLPNLAKAANYKTIICTDEWIAREFSMIITPNLDNPHDENIVQKNDTYVPFIYKSLHWLNQIIATLKKMPHDKPRGIWGTAIAATWATSIMDHKVDFFVDEDPQRIGKMHLGKPIYHPENIPVASHIFIALTPGIVKKIISHWTSPKYTLHYPSELVY